MLVKHCKFKIPGARLRVKRIVNAAFYPLRELRELRKCPLRSVSQDFVSFETFCVPWSLGLFKQQSVPW